MYNIRSAVPLFSRLARQHQGQTIIVDIYPQQPATHDFTANACTAALFVLVAPAVCLTLTQHWEARAGTLLLQLLYAFHVSASVYQGPMMAGWADQMHAGCRFGACKWGSACRPFPAHMALLLTQAMLGWSWVYSHIRCAAGFRTYCITTDPCHRIAVTTSLHILIHGSLAFQG